MKDKTSRIPKVEPKSKHYYQELERENKQLRKELRQAEMERDILKKAAVDLQLVIVTPDSVYQLANKMPMFFLVSGSTLMQPCLGVFENKPINLFF